MTNICSIITEQMFVLLLAKLCLEKAIYVSFYVSYGGFEMNTILHIDMNNFYASVETLYNEAYRNVPMAVVGDRKSRKGIILAKNMLAKNMGVKTAEPIFQAEKKCPGLVLAEPHFDRYERYSKLAMEIYKSYTDRVESFGLDECWLDVKGSERLFGSAEKIAHEIRERVKAELGLTVSVGVSFNKVFAKLGSDYKKPDAVTVFGEEDFRQTVWELPAGDMLFIGPKAANTLARYGIHTIGDVAKTEMSVLKRLCGRAGESMWLAANGRDNSPVREAASGREIKSIGNSMTLPQDITATSDVKTALLSLAETVAARLRKHGKKCGEVQISIRSSEFEDVQRQCHIAVPADDSQTLYETAVALYLKENPRFQIRGLGIRAGDLYEAGEGQLTLFPEGEEQKRRTQLESVVDKLSDRYGKGSVKSAMLFDECVTDKDRERHPGFCK